MFSYYGRKHKIVGYYPPPKFEKIIEPFAGSASYAYKYWQKDILLIDKYPVIIGIWHYLQSASKNDILGLPKLQKGDDLNNFNLTQPEKDFLGFLICAGVSQPAKKVASFEGIGINRGMIEKTANNLHKIKHWIIKQGDYVDLENEEATWFIDPPYQFGGEHYKESSKNLDFKQLAKWCKSRNGQTIVCENTKADWLPFKPMKKMVGSVHTTMEAIWSNHKTNYDAVQQSLQF